MNLSRPKEQNKTKNEEKTLFSSSLAFTWEDKIISVLSQADEPKYRLLQAKKALFQDLIEDWQEAKNLPLLLRKRLNEDCPIKTIKKTLVFESKNVVKAVFELKDSLKIETVLMRHKDKRNTVCLSSQVGCPLSCSFCATGKMGFKRNLATWEIVEQALFFARYLKKRNERISNIVFMGMGEPFLNYENVIESIKILNDKKGFNLSSRSFSISTVGIVEGIEKIAEEKLQINLAVSLHASNNELRTRLMPVNKKYPIEKILKAIDRYLNKKKRKVMFEYIMIKDLNDSQEQAQSLVRLMKKPLYLVNLIPCNLTGDFKPSSSLKIKKFKKVLENKGVAVTQRYAFGQKIKAACGQLAAKDNN